MREITTKVYKYTELSKEAKEKAIENNLGFNVYNSFWDEFVLEDRTIKLEEYGFQDPKILYSGFCSQGDGACFTAELDNGGLLEFITKTKTLSKYKTLVKAINNCDIYVNIKITHGFMYYHEYSTTIADYTEMQSNMELTGKLLEEYTALMETFDRREANNSQVGWYVDECKDIYKHLRAEYDYQTEYDAIAESLEANEMKFTIDGNDY